VRVAEEIIRSLGAAADAGELGDPVRQDIQLEEGLDECGGDRVVAAAGAERRDLAFVVAAGIADLVLREGRVVELGFGEVGHESRSFAALRMTAGRTWRRSEERRVGKECT